MIVDVGEECRINPDNIAVIIGNCAHLANGKQVMLPLGVDLSVLDKLPDKDPESNVVPFVRPSTGSATQAEVIQALKIYEGMTSKQDAVKVLRDFGAQSIMDLPPDLYRDVIDKLNELAGNVKL